MNEPPKVIRDHRGRVILVDAMNGIPRDCELDQNELMMRMVEATSGDKRPEGYTAEQCLTAAMDAETIDFLEKASEAAIEYFAEVLAKGTTIQ